MIPCKKIEITVVAFSDHITTIFYLSKMFVQIIYNYFFILQICGLKFYLMMN